MYIDQTMGSITGISTYLGVSFEKNILSKTFFVKNIWNISVFSQGFSNSTMEIKIVLFFVIEN
jgi:hypothetical protein